MQKLRIGSVDYTIESVPKLHERYHLFGQVTYKDTHIQIDESLSQTRANEAVIHEMLHAILFEAGYMEQDEDLVNRTASVLTQVLRDNDFGFMRGESESERFERSLKESINEARGGVYER